MKRLFASALASVVVFGSMAVLATDEALEISSVYTDGETVYVDAVNGTNEERIIVLTVMKEDEGLSDNHRLFSVLQRLVAAGECEIFDIPILDEKKGVSGTGRYIVRVSNETGDRAEKHFNWATKDDVSKFVNEFKLAASSVTESDKAYEKLLPVLTAPENAGAVFRIGIDIDKFTAYDEDVQREVMVILYETGIDSLDEESLPDAFSEIFGLSIYNKGDKAEGISIIAPKYNGTSLSDKLADSVLKNLEESYNSISEFNKGFAIAYGIETICDANAEEIGDVLNIFANETGECESIIRKINNLPALKRYDAYEYIVDASESMIKNIDELEKVLEKAYKLAAENQSSGGSGGGGGGASGSVSNRAPISGGSVSSATGSGTPDVKVENSAEYIFTDLTDEHWAAEAVVSLKNKGIISGTDTGAFEPDRDITREEFTKMIVTACGIKSDSESFSFSDLELNEWYIPYIAAAVDKGIVKGIGDNRFGIGEKITRQDMTVMAERAVNVCGFSLEKIKDYIAFADENEIADYAKESVLRLFECGIINGKENNRFDPHGNATRAEAAKIIYEAFVN